MNERPSQATSALSQRILRAILPVGIVLIVAWAVLLVVAIALDGTQVGYYIALAAFGLLTSLTLIVSGLHYRRALRRP